VLQRALSLKSRKPRLAEALIAASSPAIHSSKGARPETIVRSNVAIALATVSVPISSPG